MENQMEKNMEHEMEAGEKQGCIDGKKMETTI